MPLFLCCPGCGLTSDIRPRPPCVLAAGSPRLGACRCGHVTPLALGTHGRQGGLECPHPVRTVSRFGAWSGGLEDDTPGHRQAVPGNWHVLSGCPAQDPLLLARTPGGCYGRGAGGCCGRGAGSRCGWGTMSSRGRWGSCLQSGSCLGVGATSEADTGGSEASLNAPCARLAAPQLTPPPLTLPVGGLHPWGPRGCGEGVGGPSRGVRGGEASGIRELGSEDDVASEMQQAWGPEPRVLAGKHPSGWASVPRGRAQGRPRLAAPAQMPVGDRGRPHLRWRGYA